jgi:hypothetical protein
MHTDLQISSCWEHIMSDLFSSLLIFTLIKTFFFTVSNFYKNLVKWALTEIESSVAGTTTLDRQSKQPSPQQWRGR